MGPRAVGVAFFVVTFASLAGCGEGPSPADAGAPDGAAPGCVFHGIAWSHESVGVVPGTTRDVSLALRRDITCDLEVFLDQSGPGSVTGLPPSVTFRARAETRIPLAVTGEREGPVTVRAHGVDPLGTPFEATIEVAVTPATLPACEGSARGRLAPGGAIVVSDGTLAGARVAVAEGASRDDRYHVDPFTVAIACAPDQVPSGYLALGPAVSFTSDEVYRFRREIDFAIPVRLSLLPSHAHRGHVELAYTGPSVREPRIVALSSPVFEGSAGGGLLRFKGARLGTYQAVVRADAPTRRMRTFRYRGILGFSMGGSGSGRIGVGNPDRFDFVAPLGGPTDWIYMLEYIRRYHLGGFCTEAQRADDLADGSLDECGAASQARAPDRGELYEHVQHFEHWWYEDGYDGQGGVFDRRDYFEIFRDLAAMFGNPNTDRSADPREPNITPPGVPDEDRFLPDAERCAAAGVRRIPPEPPGGDTDPATGFFDDEYNPEGRYPVITFCDGAQRVIDGRTDVGLWDPSGRQYVPAEVVYAVDIDDDGVRDAGEPVIRNMREPFADVGPDGVPSVLEPGYHPIANPDPAGDDYDFFYNPSGTEGNWDWDEGEPFDDVGIDGVPGTPQLAEGGYDSGEGDGVFTRTRGSRRMIESSPRGMIRTYDVETIRSFDFFADGGVRDLFNWVVMGHHTLGGFAARGLPVRYYDSHEALHLSGSNAFNFANVPWDEVGRYFLVRYGSIDASEAAKILGDGGHVGTVDQLTNRIFSALSMMDRRWPNGDRRRVSDRICPAISPSCPHVNSMTIDFTSERAGRTGPMTIILPPGYFDPEYADYRYPVVFFLHGYGMQPMDLQALGILLWNNMLAATLPEHQRIQKMIFVFPDGRCRNRECLKGTFYTDAPESTPNGARMQVFLLDFMDYMDRTFRTRAPEIVEVVE
jgi:hypothetical protein